MKRAFRALFQNTVSQRLLGQADRLINGRDDQLRVLTYHLIDDLTGFEQQVRYLAENYHVASMVEFAAALQGKTSLPAHSVLITFDDAYQNFAECAWPVLKRYDCPVTLFVPTAYPDAPHRAFWWDRLEYAFQHTQRREPLETPLGLLPLSTAGQRGKTFKQLRAYVKSISHQPAMDLVEDVCEKLSITAPGLKVLGWDALRQLSREGVTLGAHTRTHPFLTRVSPEEAHAEVRASFDDLRREIGEILPVFAYPDGQYSPAVVRAVRAAGIRIAFSTERGSVSLRSSDPLRLRRNNLGRQATTSVLQARLLQASAWFDPLRPLPAG